MERLRCAQCRNPIRHPGSGRTPRDDAWYHPDCWEDAVSSWQEGYHDRIRTGGLEALLAPYVMAALAPLVGRVATPLEARPQA